MCLSKESYVKNGSHQGKDIILNCLLEMAFDNLWGLSASFNEHQST